MKTISLLASLLLATAAQAVTICQPGPGGTTICREAGAPPTVCRTLPSGAVICH